MLTIVSWRGGHCHKPKMVQKQFEEHEKSPQGSSGFYDALGLLQHQGEIHHTADCFNMILNLDQGSYTLCFLYVFQARQVLEREFNNLLALGTDRRLDEVNLF